MANIYGNGQGMGDQQVDNQKLDSFLSGLINEHQTWMGRPNYGIRRNPNPVDTSPFNPFTDPFGIGSKSPKF